MHMLDLFKYCPHCGSNQFQPNHHNSKKCHDCGFEFFKNAPAAVACIILDDNGRILALRRAKDPYINTLDTPGGFVDIGETAEQAAIRELKEETNIDIEVTKLLYTIPNTYVYKGYDATPLDLFFECKIKDMSNIKLQKSEVSEILFLEKNEIDPTEFGLPSIQKALTRYLNK